MEARWLFGVEMDQVQVVVQPQSVIHSMVEFEDGAVIAQLGTPDMKLPIQYALYYPERRFLPGDRLDFCEAGSRLPLKSRIWRLSTDFPLAFEAGRRGGTHADGVQRGKRAGSAKFLDREDRISDHH